MAEFVIMKIVNKYRFRADMQTDNQEQFSKLEKNFKTCRRIVRRYLLNPTWRSKWKKFFTICHIRHHILHEYSLTLKKSKLFIMLDLLYVVHLLPQVCNSLSNRNQLSSLL
jgi:ribosomal protein L11 methylase PrmA